MPSHLVARARFMLRLRDYLAEHGSGVSSMSSLLGWAPGYFAIQTACLLVQLAIGPTSQAFVSATVVLSVMTVLLTIGRCLFPGIVERDYESLRAVVELHARAPGLPESTQQ